MAMGEGYFPHRRTIWWWHSPPQVKRGRFIGKLDVGSLDQRAAVPNSNAIKMSGAMYNLETATVDFFVG